MILWLSLAACLLVSMYLPVLGQQVLKRRIIFVDLALAQVAAMGYAIGLATEGSGMLYAAIITAIAVLLLAALPDKTELPKEGMMGAIYALAASAGVMILSSLPHAEGQMMTLLFGSMLGVDEAGLATLAVSGALAVILMRFAQPHTYLGRLCFYASLAIAVVPAIYSMGVVLVFSLLVIPSLAVWRGQAQSHIGMAIMIAASGSGLGIFLANNFDYSPSSAVVVSLALVACVVRASQSVFART